MNSISSFFEANSYAIIGATADQSKLGWHIVDNFLRLYQGQVYLINIKGGKIAGHPVYKSVLEIENPIDSAVIAIPARFVKDALAECVKKGIKSVVIESGGFAEISKNGAKEQQKIVELVKDTQTRIIGPNCIGVFSPKNGIDTIFIPQSRVPRPQEGQIAFMTQSGALGSAMLDSFTIIGNGKWISRFASFGNACDVNESDLLEYFGSDDETKIILAHLEGFKTGENFLRLSKQISKTKPIILLKTGRTKLGMKASTSHSASLATDDEVVTALLKQHGIIRISNYYDLLSVAKVFLTQGVPSGNRVGIVTDGGGFAVIGSDSIENEGLSLAKISETTIQSFRSKYPSWYICNNPLDLTGTVTAEEFIHGIRCMYFDDQVDILVPIIIPSAPNFNVREFDELLSEFVTELRNDSTIVKKTILAVSLGGPDTQIINSKLDKLDIPYFDTPEEVFRIVKYLVNYRRFLNDLEVDVN